MIARKVSGFVGHSAYCACSRLKPFPTAVFGEKPDYSGFCRGTWLPRTTESHIGHASHYKCDKTQTTKKLSMNMGVGIPCYLSSHIISCDSVIDPMHNILLDTAKHMLTIWKSRDIVSDSQFHSIQELVCSPDVGRISGKIASVFSNLLLSNGVTGH